MQYNLIFTKEEITAYLLNKLNITDFQTAINLKADLANVYLKTDLYTKTEITTGSSGKSVDSRSKGPRFDSFKC